MSQDSSNAVQEQFVVRMPHGMREMIGRASRKNGRSMNAEIVSRLLSTFETEQSPDAMALETLVSEVTGLSSRIKELAEAIIKKQSE